MQIKLEQNSGTNIIKLSGEIDLYNSPDVRKKITELISHKTPHIIVDLSEVTYMDSSGLATLVEALQKTKQYNGHLRIAGLKGEVKSIFEIARLEDIFQIYENTTSALENL